MVLHHITGVTPGVTLSVVLVCGGVSRPQKTRKEELERNKSGRKEKDQIARPARNRAG